MKAIVIDTGDRSVGIFEQYFEVQCPFDSDIDSDSLEYFRAKISELYSEFADGKLIVKFENED